MQSSKKLMASLVVFFVFVIYSLGMRHQTPTIAKPKSLKSNSPANSPSNATTNNTATTNSSSNTGSSNSSTTSGGQYKDGTYTGNTYDAYYGNVQVSVTINSGKITTVNILQYPNSHSTSTYINQQAMPYLQQEAVQAQNANVQLISGATFTSQAFIQSLSSALSKA
jgi:uncharacterized protein with FMN-binding domain